MVCSILELRFRPDHPRYPDWLAVDRHLGHGHQRAVHGAAGFWRQTFLRPDRFLEIQVQPAGGSLFTPLSARQKLTAVPYALALPNLRTEASQNGPTFLRANVWGDSSNADVTFMVTGSW